MRYSISETTKTVTVETTEADGQVSLTDMEKAVKRFSRQYVDEPATQALTFQPETVVTEAMPDPLEDLSYTDVDPYTLATEELEHMVPANYLAAE